MINIKIKLFMANNGEREKDAYTKHILLGQSLFWKLASSYNKYIETFLFLNHIRALTLIY